jgi:hypothetical protein
MRKASGVKLAAKGVFVPEAGSDPSETGATIQFVAADGAVLYSSDIAASSFKSKPGGRYRFSASRAQSELLSNGITRFDIRTKHGNEWHITLKAETPLLEETFLESSITWMIRVGSDCARRRSMTCEPGNERSNCV